MLDSSSGCLEEESSPSSWFVVVGLNSIETEEAEGSVCRAHTKYKVSYIYLEYPSKDTPTSNSR